MNHMGSRLVRVRGSRKKGGKVVYSAHAVMRMRPCLFFFRSEVCVFILSGGGIFGLLLLMSWHFTAATAGVS